MLHYSPIVTGSLVVSGSIVSTEGIQLSGSIENAVSASYVAGANVDGTVTSASYVAGANVDGTVTSASYAITASHVAIDVSRNTPISYVTTTSTASAYNLVVISASANIALPSSPNEGDWIEFSNRSAATASLNPNGNKVMGDTGSFTIDNANAGFKITYTDANHGWVLVGVQGTTI